MRQIAILLMLAGLAWGQTGTLQYIGASRPTLTTVDTSWTIRWNAHRFYCIGGKPSIRLLLLDSLWVDSTFVIDNNDTIPIRQWLNRRPELVPSETVSKTIPSDIPATPAKQMRWEWQKLADDSTRPITIGDLEAYLKAVENDTTWDSVKVYRQYANGKHVDTYMEWPGEYHYTWLDYLYKYCGKQWSWRYKSRPKTLNGFLQWLKQKER